MEKNRNHMTERILKLTLEIIYLLTGEDYVPLKRDGGYTMAPAHALTHEKSNDQKILELAQKIIELLTGEDLDSSEIHKDFYKEIKMEECHPRKPVDGSRNMPLKCHSSLYPKGCTEDNKDVTEESQVPTLPDHKHSPGYKPKGAAGFDALH
ncbi:gastrula zinc finger protein XlCGF53.1-like [Hyla sarda]|uniref:gastrula zinc finger protein XlCGF53.1-like n=1 Tax=Hyla sarda TaxID=327740 RepID=UPI0024C25470|nr:gastrula zinc finger protein XlCGF53.1-like [Hyla sarda]